MPVKNRMVSALIMLPEDLLEQIKAYQEENNIRTKNEAIRTLIRNGLEDSQE